MQTTGDALGEQIMPDTAAAVGSEAAQKAGPDFCTDSFIAYRTLAGRPDEPTVKATARDTEHLAEPGNRQQLSASQ